MSVSLYHSATEYIFVPITIARGTVAGIVSVGLYINTSVVTIPIVSDFTTCTLIDGTATPPLDPLAVAGEIDISALVGPRSGVFGSGAGLTVGTYQVYCLIKTANEDVIRRLDTLTIL